MSKGDNHYNEFKLSELGNLKNGLNFTNSDIEQPCKIIGVGDFDNNVYPLYEQLGYVDRDKVSKDFLLREDDIVFVRSNGNKNLVGRTMLIKNIKEEITFSGFCIRFRTDSSIVYPEYLFYSLRAPYCRKQYSYSQQTNITNLSQEILANVIVRLPSLNEQKRIADILSNIDMKIKNNKEINDNLLQQATGIFEYWFKQFNYPTPNNTPYKSSGGSLYWNDKLNRYIPMEITNITVGEITICHDSKRIPLSNNERLEKQGTIPYYGATGIMDYVDDYIFNGDYVLLAEDGSVMTDQGTPILQRITGKSWVNNHAHVLEPVEGYSCLLLYMLLKDIPVVQIKTGSIQYKINQQNLNAYQVLCLPEYLRKLYIQKTVAIESEMLKIQSENQKLISLRNWLLPMLMNGQATIDD